MDYVAKYNNINKGTIKDGKYIKEVKFSKAVLWKSRELSLRASIMQKIKKAGVTQIIFIDKGKREKWIFKAEDVFTEAILKSVGQEPQWYFPIELAKKESVELF